MAHVGLVVSTTQTRNIPQWDAELRSQGRVWVGEIPSLVGCGWNLGFRIHAHIEAAPLQFCS